MKYSALLVILLLCGCVSYSKIQSKIPALEFMSAKAPAAFAGCVSPKFMEIWPGMVAVIPDKSDTVVTVGANGVTMVATVTISPMGTGSNVILREAPHINLGRVYEKAAVALQSCK